MRLVSTVVAVMIWCTAFADIKVSDVDVFSDYPWTEVVVGYTITGSDENADGIRLTATDKSTNKSYVAKNMEGAMLTEGRHVLRWNAADDGVKFSSANVVFTVSVMKLDGVQLWENGPYWAECNVGATKPEEYGYYFWWGDTVGYTLRGGTLDRWPGGTVIYDGVIPVASMGNDGSSAYGPILDMSIDQLHKAGYLDVTDNLIGKHNAARAHLGVPWRMPTDAEFAGLISKCTTTLTHRNGVYGCLVTGKGEFASNCIFLPAVGASPWMLLGDTCSHVNPGRIGSYWSSTPYTEDNRKSWRFFFDLDEVKREDSFRNTGCAVRPVRLGR